MKAPQSSGGNFTARRHRGKAAAKEVENILTTKEREEHEV
jgi:hypothetical protein